MAFRHVAFEMSFRLPLFRILSFGDLRWLGVFKPKAAAKCYVMCCPPAKPSNLQLVSPLQTCRYRMVWGRRCAKVYGLRSTRPEFSSQVPPSGGGRTPRAIGSHTSGVAWRSGPYPSTASAAQAQLPKGSIFLLPDFPQLAFLSIMSVEIA